MSQEWKCSLRDSDFNLQVELFVYRESFGGGIEYAHIEDGHMMLTEGKRHEPVKPLICLSEMMAREVFKSLSEALDRKGFKPDSNAKLEGTLEATKAHLSDLRKMLKLK